MQGYPRIQGIIDRSTKGKCEPRDRRPLAFDPLPMIMPDSDSMALNIEAMIAHVKNDLGKEGTP
jgi:hypothetical protein